MLGCREVPKTDVGVCSLSHFPENQPFEKGSRVTPFFLKSKKGMEKVIALSYAIRVCRMVTQDGENMNSMHFSSGWVQTHIF